jgi:antitoxin (DNA-binding transcriptional repressor) of toxin-antitoxin stability system
MLRHTDRPCLRIVTHREQEKERSPGLPRAAETDQRGMLRRLDIPQQHKQTAIIAGVSR